MDVISEQSSVVPLSNTSPRTGTLAADHSTTLSSAELPTQPPNKSAVSDQCHPDNSQESSAKDIAGQDAQAGFRETDVDRGDHSAGDTGGSGGADDANNANNANNADEEHIEGPSLNLKSSSYIAKFGLSCESIPESLRLLLANISEPDDDDWNNCPPGPYRYWNDRCQHDDGSTEYDGHQHSNRDDLGNHTHNVDGETKHHDHESDLRYLDGDGFNDGDFDQYTSESGESDMKLPLQADTPQFDSPENKHGMYYDPTEKKGSLPVSTSLPDLCLPRPETSGAPFLEPRYIIDSDFSSDQISTDSDQDTPQFKRDMSEDSHRQASVPPICTDSEPGAPEVQTMYTSNPYDEFIVDNDVALWSGDELWIEPDPDEVPTSLIDDLVISPEISSRLDRVNLKSSSKAIYSSDMEIQEEGDEDDQLGDTIEDFPVSRGLKLITSGSTCDEHFPYDGDDVSIKDVGIPNTLVELAIGDNIKPDMCLSSADHIPLASNILNIVRSLRRVKEHTINHNDFAPLDEGGILDWFLIEDDRPQNSSLDDDGGGLTTVLGHGSLYSKDFKLSESESTHGAVENGDPVTWNDHEEMMRSMTSAIEFDIDISAVLRNLDEIDKPIEVEPPTILDHEFFVPGPLYAASNCNAPLTASMGPETQESDFSPLPSTAHGDGTTRSALSSVTLLEHVADSAKTLSPLGTVTALLVSRGGDNGPQAQSLFHEKNQTAGISVLSTKGTMHAEQSPAWVFNNRFVASQPSTFRRRRSIRRIFFPKSANSINQPTKVPCVTDYAGGRNGNDTGRRLSSGPSDVKVEEHTKDSIRIKSIWRSGTFRRHFSGPLKYSLDSGVSIEGTAAEYISRRDLSLPRPEDFVSNNTESVRRVFSLNESTAVAQDEEHAIPYIQEDVTDSQETLSSLIVEKGFASLKPIQEHITTPAPFPSQAGLLKMEAGRKRHHLFGLTRSKTATARQPTIRFAASPLFMNESDPKVRNPESDLGLLTSEGKGRRRSILKRSSTMRETGSGAGAGIHRSLSALRSLFRSSEVP